jgi:hypothetical protein
MADLRKPTATCPGTPDAGIRTSGVTGAGQPAERPAPATLPLSARTGSSTSSTSVRRRSRALDPPWCEATECASAEECSEGSCQEQGLCVEEREVACGGMRPDTAEPCTITQHVAHRTCRDQGDCDVGTCVVVNRCVVGGPFRYGCATGVGGGERWCSGSGCWGWLRGGCERHGSGD